jgi:hypothetical protein
MQLAARVWIAGIAGLSAALVVAPAAHAESKLVYGITPDGRLEQAEHVDWLEGGALPAPTTIGSGWDQFTRVFSGCSGVFYGIRPNGDLVWHKHAGSVHGGVEWLGPRTVDTGWGGYREVFADCSGVVYAITPGGQLQWRRHVGWENGTEEWRGPTVIAEGWAIFDKVFSGCPGILYGIKPSGEILWNHHLDTAHGSAQWRGPESVGTGWVDLQHVFSGCDGIIYVQKSTGEIRWIKHLGHLDGRDDWDGPLLIRAGPSYTAAFATPLDTSAHPPDRGCPNMDALSLPVNTGLFMFTYPPEQTSVFAATWEEASGKRRPGSAGVAAIVDVIMRSLAPGCLPVGAVYTIAGADVDARGRDFENNVSIERAWTAGSEIKAALEAVRVPALALGRIIHKRVYFTSAGLGARLAKRSPASEDERRANRRLTVFLVQEHYRGEKAAAPTDAADAPDAPDSAEAFPYRE